MTSTRQGAFLSMCSTVEPNALLRFRGAPMTIREARPPRRPGSSPLLRAPVRVLQTVAGLLAADLPRVPDALLAVRRRVVRKGDVRASVRADLDLEEVEQRTVAADETEDSLQADVAVMDAARVRARLLDRRGERVRVSHLREVDVPVVGRA